MPKSAKDNLKCPHCKQALTFEEVLDTTDDCWPNQEWIAFGCPYCSKRSHAKLNEKSLAVGELDGFPGPCFISLSRCALKGVEVAWAEDGVDVKYGKTKKKIAARV